MPKSETKRQRVNARKRTVDHSTFAWAQNSILRIPSSAVGPRAGAGAAGLIMPNAGGKPPLFLLPPASAFAGMWESFLLIFSREDRASSRRTIYLFRHGNVGRAPMPGKTVGASFALHCGALLLVIYASHAIPSAASSLVDEAPTYEIIYYPLPPANSSKPLPRITPAGPGAHPGNGAIRQSPPAFGSSAQQNELRAVSNPVHPDNFRQTIYQRSSPPDLRIETEMNLPNVVLSAPSEAPKLPLNTNYASPARAARKVTSDEAPTPLAQGSDAPLATFLKPSVTPPRLPIPVSGAAKPTLNGAAGGRRDSGNGEGANIPDGTDLLVLGVDPAGPATVVSIPAGNRWGNFSISPAGKEPGSAGGVNYGMVAGGKGGIGAGGDGSTGVGPGGDGGGGGSSGPSGVVSVKGAEDGSGTGGQLENQFALSMVYPVPPTFTVRKNSLIVAVGPMGGGGLDAYGALHCGKIYSIFLSMPGQSWAMQYCVKSSTVTKSAADSRGTVVHLEQGLVPPDAEARFDFRRIPVPPEKAYKKIVLKGTLRDDGVVENLEVFQGVLPEMDAAARAAFGQWKFKPAMRDGKPVPVEILIGIPIENSSAALSQ
jgi:Gram-negative bacterial TonB protein C-terminal